MYTMRFWFEHGGGCLWGMDKETQARYGYKISPAQLPVSKELKECLTALEKRYATYLNWEDPAAGPRWSAQETAAFLEDASAAYAKLCDELGTQYTVKNEIDASVGR